MTQIYSRCSGYIYLNHFICASTSVHSTLPFSSYDFIMFTPRKLLVANITIIVYIGSMLYNISFPPRMYIYVYFVCVCVDIFSSSFLKIFPYRNILSSIRTNPFPFTLTLFASSSLLNIDPAHIGVFCIATNNW